METVEGVIEYYGNTFQRIANALVNGDIDLNEYKRLQKETRENHDILLATAIAMNRHRQFKARRLNAN